MMAEEAKDQISLVLSLLILNMLQLTPLDELCPSNRAQHRKQKPWKKKVRATHSLKHWRKKDWRLTRMKKWPPNPKDRKNEEWDEDGTTLMVLAVIVHVKIAKGNYVVIGLNSE
jgi:hypothetical protein